MTNDSQFSRQDQAHPEVMQIQLGFGREQVSDLMWRCDVLRAGQLYSRSLFGSQAEAEQFAQRVQRSEPDHVFSVEAIKASTVWN